jgi:hypothetical protein
MKHYLSVLVGKQRNQQCVFSLSSELLQADVYRSSDPSDGPHEMSSLILAPLSRR